MAPARNAWLKQRNRGFRVTIRDVDCRDFDVGRFIDDLASMHATFFSFLYLAGGLIHVRDDIALHDAFPSLRDESGLIVRYKAHLSKQIANINYAVSKWVVHSHP